MFGMYHLAYTILVAMSFLRPRHVDASAYVSWLVGAIGPGSAGCVVWRAVPMMVLCSLRSPAAGNARCVRIPAIRARNVSWGC